MHVLPSRLLIEFLVAIMIAEVRVHFRYMYATVAYVLLLFVNKFTACDWLCVNLCVRVHLSVGASICYAERLPIGLMQVIKTISAENVRAFYSRHYHPQVNQQAFIKADNNGSHSNICCT